MTPEQLADDLAQMADQLADIVLDTNKAAGATVLADSQPPVDTGYLASTGAVVADAGGFDVVYTARYAPYVHARNPFLARSFTENESRIVDLYVNAVTEVVH